MNGESMKTEVMAVTEERKALGGIRRRDEQGLIWVIRKYTPYVSTIVHQIIGAAMSSADVEEVTSDVFLALWDGAKGVQSGKLKPWLGAVARNKARERLRQAGLTLPLEEDVLILEQDDMTKALEAKEQAELVSRAVLQMTPPDNEIFLRHYYYGQTVAVIAGKLNMKESTVKSRLRRGREKLRKALTEGGYGVEAEHF